MIRSLLKFTALVLLGFAVAGIPTVLHAQNTNAATATNKPPANPSAHLPFHGKVKSIDNANLTVTVDARTFQITSQTIITKDGKPATFSDAAVGDNVTGSVRREKNGKYTALKLNFGIAAPKRSLSNTRTNTP